jgi:hypothetical protein
MRRRIVGLEIEEVSLVSRAANPLAKIMLLKSADAKKAESEELREKIDVLDRAWELSERTLKACGLRLNAAYSAYDRALTDLVGGRASAEAGALAILSVTKAELSN